MPSVAENRAKWTGYDWPREGHEWSPGGSRGGTDLLWSRTILPRIQSHLPTGTLLEIAPGFGRWTDYLTGFCDRLIGVDVTERCVEVCQTRFAGRPGVEFHLNDGESLAMVECGSIDFAFSFDSLVHVEAPQIRAYLVELARTLKPAATGFIHHSNLGVYNSSRDGVPGWVTKRHWRAASMSAKVFRDACREAGLRPVSQEVINWIGRGARADQHRLPGPEIALTDCMSVVVRADHPDRPEPTLVYINRHFVDEWRQLLLMTPLYGSHENLRPCPGPLPATAPGATAQPISRLKGLAGRARSYGAERLASRTFLMREPFVRALRSGVCPDCGTVLMQGTWKLCRTCCATFALA
jgi:hypothetical protein